jgi:hypothetical protein
MNWLWTWGGSSCGYRAAGELWTYDGHHVGRFRGAEIYQPDGLYLGEVMNEDRLIIDTGKAGQYASAFSRLPRSAEHPPGFGFNRAALPEGYSDFPRPARFR